MDKLGGSMNVEKAGFKLEINYEWNKSPHIQK